MKSRTLTKMGYDLSLLNLRGGDFVFFINFKYSDIFLEIEMLFIIT